MSLQKQFLEALPRIETHARLKFRHMRCTFTRDDLIAEVVAIAWKCFVRLTERGKDPMTFVSAIATFSVKQVRAGRKLTGMEAPQDAISPRAQREKGFVAGKLGDTETYSSNPLADALIDNTMTPVPDAVAFRVDFPVWHARLNSRDQSMVTDLLMGVGTNAVARKYGVTPPRVTQIRGELKQGWELSQQ